MAKKDMNQLNLDTIIGSNAKVKGNLITEGDVTIDGILNGNVKAEGSINMGTNGNVTGNLIGRNVNISGTLTGNITAADDTSISSTGEVAGDITTGNLNIERGAIFFGLSKMTQPRRIKSAEAEE